MDVTELAVATIYLLKPHLSSLLHYQSLDQSDETVDKIWDTIYPILATIPLAVEALNQAAETPSEDNFNILKARLESLYSQDKAIARRIAYLIGFGIQQGKLGSDAPELAPFIAPDFLEKLSQKHAPTVRVEDLRCQVCGRQDETLRLVAFPYVVSLIVVTSRRAFSGLWCEKHARNKQILATLITAAIGWFGIPFGFIYTPITLFTLVKGGKVEKEKTRRVLEYIAQHRLEQQDVSGAVRCIEAALRHSPDDPPLRQQLSDLYADTISAPSTASRVIGIQFLSFLGVILLASIMGIVIGAVDYLTEIISGALLSGSASIFIVILTWVPLVAGAFIAGVILTQIIQKALNFTRTRHMILAGSLAVVSSLLLIHHIMVGYLLVDLINYWEPKPFIEALWTIGYFMIKGSTFLASYFIGEGYSTYAVIYLLVLLAASFYYLTITTSESLAAARWQKTLAAIRKQGGQVSSRAPISGWLSIMGAVLSFLVLTVYFSFPFYGPYTEPEAMALIEEGFALMEQGQMDQAVALMTEAVELAPQDAVTHWASGLVHYRKGECQTALTEFETALALDPAQELLPTFYYGTARSYECLYDYEQAFAMYEQAIELDPNRTDVYLDMGLTYLQMGLMDKALQQFEQAASIDPQSSAAYAFLAVAYYQIDQEEKMTAAIDQSKELLTDEMYDQSAMAVFYIYRNDFSVAELHLENGLEQVPDHFNLKLQLALVYAAQGKFEEAHQLVDQAAEATWDETTLHLSRSGIYFYQEDLDSAGAEALEALKVNPQSAGTYDQLAVVYYYLGDIEQAATYAQQALDLDPYQPSAYNTLARVYYDEGRLDDALQAVQRSIEINPKGDLAYYVIGLCYMEQGQSDEAVRAFETFLELTWDRAFVRDYVPKAEEYLQQLENE